MRDDPKGYYSRLEIDPQASAQAIAAAFRRKARILHPDVPGTGDTAAFVAVKEAYEILTDPLQRAAYDRLARQAAEAWPAAAVITPAPRKPASTIWARGPRFSDLPLAISAAMAALVLIAAVEVAIHLANDPEHPGSKGAGIPATAPNVAAASVEPAAPPVHLPGAPNAYVVPAGGSAVVWRKDVERFVSFGRLPPFSTVQALRFDHDKGLVEIRVSETANAYVDAARLAPGNAAAAHQAYCAYNAGPPPLNAEILSHTGQGPGGITVVNRSGQPAVVKLRTTEGQMVASVFLSPFGHASIAGLPIAEYRPEYAIGELWSRACNRFAAGMRAQRFAEFTPLEAMEPLTIPPDLSSGPAPEDISDQAFEHP